MHNKKNCECCIESEITLINNITETASFLSFSHTLSHFLTSALQFQQNASALIIAYTITYTRLMLNFLWCEHHMHDREYDAFLIVFRSHRHFMALPFIFSYRT